MFASIRRYTNIYGAMAAIVPKEFLAYSIWVWMELVVQAISLVIFVSFWTAVYANDTTIAGLNLQQTLNYIILAQIFLPAVHAPTTIYYFGDLMREGQMGIELLRPIDFQASVYVRNLAQVGIGLILQLPIALIGWLLFRYQVPLDPLIWLAFLITLLLGNTLVFFFDWIIACISFYSTETWGLSVVRFGVATFFSGALIPLVMMPDWLQAIAGATPFAQALYVPVSLLSGITPLSAMPRLWLTQIIYIIALWWLSRRVFNIAVRKVTVQGG